MEKPKKIVVDASVAAKWYVPEEHSQQALELRDDFRSRRVDLIAPHLLLYEVANGLRYSPELSPDQILDATDALITMQITLIHLDPPHWRRAVGNALRFDISLYDSAYYTTAESHALRLLTADRRLFRKLHGKSTLLLEDYQHTRI